MMNEDKRGPTETTLTLVMTHPTANPNAGGGALSTLVTRRPELIEGGYCRGTFLPAAGGPGETC